MTRTYFVQGEYEADGKTFPEVGIFEIENPYAQDGETGHVSGNMMTPYPDFVSTEKVEGVFHKAVSTIRLIIRKPRLNPVREYNLEKDEGSSLEGTYTGFWSCVNKEGMHDGMEHAQLTLEAIV